MSRFHRVLTAVALMISAGCAFSRPEPPSPRVVVSPSYDAYSPRSARLAIYVEDRTNRGLSRGSLRAVEDEFMQFVVARGYILAARSDIDQIRRELNLQASEITEAALARMARILNVYAILVVSINQLDVTNYQPMVQVSGQQYYAASASISARIITAEQGEVVWVSSYHGAVKVGTYDAGPQALPVIASIVASGLPAHFR